jgi:hypothetical protein
MRGLCRTEVESIAEVTRFGLDLNWLLFDATNFFTFLDSFNSRAKLIDCCAGKFTSRNVDINNLVKPGCCPR